MQGPFYGVTLFLVVQSKYYSLCALYEHNFTSIPHHRIKYIQNFGAPFQQRHFLLLTHQNLTILKYCRHLKC